MELICKVQNYEWGKKGSTSTVAKLVENVNRDFHIDENLPYAELWMGTHVNAPSVLMENGVTLSSVIEQQPEYLGSAVLKEFGEQLPFLFKVLSVNKALSIQAHPSKKHAEELHAKFPNIYKDPNHKPELAIALTPFEALCGFRPISEIKSFVEDIPEFKRVTGIEKHCDDIEFLKKSFRAVLTCDKDVISEEISNMLERFSQIDDSKRKSQLTDLVIRLNNQYPYDVGIFMVYFLNYIKLKPSEALYLGANEPHAYISGDCIECMACSDNVVRAGLTPKLIDIETLCAMLIYKGQAPNEKLFLPIIEDTFSKIFRPPVPDFAVAYIEVPSEIKKYTMIERSTASILLVTSGNGRTANSKLKPGTTLFIPAGVAIEISDISATLQMYQALANV